ncbi:MAG: cupin domain-containing protein [Clostridia bacterium]
MKTVNQRIYELRTFSDFSVSDIAAKLGISQEEYLAFENGTNEVPIWLVYKFATLVEMEPSYIINGTIPTKKNAAVVYENKGEVIERYPGYSFMSLASDFQDKQMKPMLVTISPTDKPELVCHDGQEFNYVLEGLLRVIVGDEEYYLRKGDSLYFNPNLPHAQLAMGETAAKFITVINE